MRPIDGPSRLNTATPVKCCNMSCITHTFSVTFDSMGWGLCGAGGYVTNTFLWHTCNSDCFTIKCVSFFA